MLRGRRQRNGGRFTAGNKDFYLLQRPTRLLRPTLSPVQRIPQASFLSAEGVKVSTHLHLKQSFRVRGTIIAFAHIISWLADYQTHYSHLPLHIHIHTYTLHTYTHAQKQTWLLISCILNSSANNRQSMNNVCRMLYEIHEHSLFFYDYTKYKTKQ
jgi:hypothetical protein